MILGPRLEGQLRKTLQLSDGNPAGLWSEPIAVGIYVIVAIILLWPLLMMLWRKFRPQTVPRIAGLHVDGTNAEVTSTAAANAKPAAVEDKPADSGRNTPTPQEKQ